MRYLWLAILNLPATAMVYEKAQTFDAARAVLEVRCLECHTPEKAKGDLILTTRDSLIKGGSTILRIDYRG